MIQEIFGVNEHIRAVADDYAARGYEVLAPAFFDLEEKDVQLPYDQESVQRGLALANAVGLERAMEVVKSAAILLPVPARWARWVIAGAARSRCCRRFAWACRR